MFIFLKVNKISILVITLLFSISVHAFQADLRSINESKLTEPVESLIDSIMTTYYPSSEPGAAIVITKEGKEIYSKGFGLANLELEVPMTSDMIFRIASITKQITAVCILILEERGKLNIEDDFRLYLDDYPKSDTIITIENLLTNTSGIPDFQDYPNILEIEQTEFTTSEILDIFKNKPLDFKPGEHYSYSSSGYNILGAIIETVSRMTYEEFVETQIFEKLGMHNSFYDHPEEVVKNKILGYKKDSSGYKRAEYMTMSVPFSAGGLRSNVHDLAIWNRALTNGKIISKGNLSRAFEPFKLNSGELSDYGFGWEFNSFLDHKLIFHGGAIFGFLASDFYFPDKDIYIAILSNNTSFHPDLLNFLISSLILEEEIPSSIDLREDKISDYLGIYNSNDEPILVAKDSSGLYIKGSWGKDKLKPFDKNKFFVEGEETISVIFNQDSSGFIDSFTYGHRFFEEDWFTAVRSGEKKSN